MFFGKLRSYLLGRNFIIGMASLMLLAISAFATWSGMTDFIVGASGSGSASVGRSIGGLDVTNDAVIVSIVIALSLLMWIALREAFGTERTLTQRLIMMPLYFFLALWSVGFGYGFWWSLIAGQEATRASMAALQEDARDATGAIAARLDAVKIQLDNVVSWSNSQMAREETSGGSCGVASGAGRGPLYNARLSVRDQVSSLRTSITENWIAPVNRELEALRATATQSVSADSLAERPAQFATRAANIRSAARNIAARSDEIGQSTAAEMNALADAVSVEPGQQGFSCHDPTLAQRLRQAASQASQPAELALRDAVFNEGPAGVANAVKKLWNHIGAGINAGVFWVSGGMIGTATSEMDSSPITGRDLIALLATIGVDLGLFALTAFNPPPPARHTIPFEAREQIRSAIERALASVRGESGAAGDPAVDVEWIRKHLIHHRRKSYLVIPNLGSCQRNAEAGAPSGPSEVTRALAMNKLAGVLDDLRVVRWPKPAPLLFGGFDDPERPWWKKIVNPKFGKSELEKLGDEESLPSSTDLKAMSERFDSRGQDRADRASGETGEGAMRNRGLFSKAKVALDSAGWSEAAQADIEIFVLTDTEGLTPLLEVLNSFKSGLPNPSATQA